MQTLNLNIKEVENKFVITIDKKQLNANYILNLMNWLHQATIEPDKLDNYLIELQHPEKNLEVDTKCTKRTWYFSGSVNLNNQLNNINLRDFAYE